MKTIEFDSLKSLQGIDWAKIKNFYYIAKIGSFTKTAQFLNNTQPGLSRQIALLEKELGCSLFYRGARGVHLTRKGEELFELVERCFLDLKRFNHNHQAMCNNGQQRRIRICTTHAIATYVLTEHIIAYNKLHPEIVFEILANDELIDPIINDVDIAIRPFDDNATGIIQEPLFTFEKKLFASEEYIAKHGEPLTIEELPDHHIIAHAQPEKHPYADVQWILKLGAQNNKAKRPVFTSNSLECMIRVAQSGMGIIGGYEEMDIMRNSGLKRILPNTKGILVEDYISYPDYLINDPILTELKVYIVRKLSTLTF